MRPTFTITHAITAALTRIERARGFLEAATLSEDWVATMGERALVLEAHHTTHIEGTQLTLDQAERLMKGESVPEADLVARQHELNARQLKALRFLLDHAEMDIRDLEDLCPEVNRRTLQRDLQQMEDLGLLARKGAARQSLYLLKGKGL